MSIQRQKAFLCQAKVLLQRRHRSALVISTSRCLFLVSLLHTHPRATDLGSPSVMASRLLGFMGLILGKIHILDIMMRLCESHGAPLNEGLLKHVHATHNSSQIHPGFIIASMELAYEYGKLGKIKKASAIYNQALNAIKNERHSDDTKVKFFLRYAQSLAVSDASPQRYFLQCKTLPII